MAVGLVGLVLWLMKLGFDGLEARVKVETERSEFARQDLVGETEERDGDQDVRPGARDMS